ncbi:unnamed protein product [Effrenium voratum]|nr:unnamed protein product [Effrenium voratum]
MAISGSAKPFFDALATLEVQYESLLAENRQLRTALCESENIGRVAPRDTDGAAEDAALHALQVDEDLVPGNADSLRPRLLYREGCHGAAAAVAGARNARRSNSPQTLVRTSVSSSTPRRKSAAGPGPADRLRHSFFENQEMVRASIRHILDRKVGESRYKDHGTCAAIAKHPFFQTMEAAVLCVYMVWMGIDADNNTALLLTEAPTIFFVADQLFCLYFFIELMIRAIAHQGCCSRIRDGWFVMDSILVSLTIFDTWVMTAIALATPPEQTTATIVRNSELLRLARIVRLTRICRMAKLVRLFPELQILIKAMLAAFRSVFFTLVLLALSHYVVAIAYCVTLSETQVGVASFSSVTAAMQTIFIHCTLLDEVMSLVIVLDDEQLYVHLALLYGVMFLNAITLMNILIGIVVEVISSVAMAERECINVSNVQDVLQSFLLFDEKGEMPKSELLTSLASPSACALEQLGIDRPVLIESLNQDMDNSPVHFENFLELVLQSRGSNAATVKDVMELRKRIARTQEAVLDKIEQVCKGGAQSPLVSVPGRGVVRGERWVIFFDDLRQMALTDPNQCFHARGT